MVTEQELQEAEQQAKAIISEQIPVRRFRAGIDIRRQQQLIQERKSLAEQNIKRIQEIREQQKAQAELEKKQRAIQFAVERGQKASRRGVLKGSDAQQIKMAFREAGLSEQEGLNIYEEIVKGGVAYRTGKAISEIKQLEKIKVSIPGAVGTGVRGGILVRDPITGKVTEQFATPAPRIIPGITPLVPIQPTQLEKALGITLAREEELRKIEPITREVPEVLEEIERRREEKFIPFITPTIKIAQIINKIYASTGTKITLKAQKVGEFIEEKVSKVATKTENILTGRQKISPFEQRKTLEGLYSQYNKLVENYNSGVESFSRKYEGKELSQEQFLQATAEGQTLDFQRGAIQQTEIRIRQTENFFNSPPQKLTIPTRFIASVALGALTTPSAVAGLIGEAFVSPIQPVKTIVKGFAELPEQLKKAPVETSGLLIGQTLGFEALGAFAKIANPRLETINIPTKFGDVTISVLGFEVKTRALPVITTIEKPKVIIQRPGLTLKGLAKEDISSFLFEFEQKKTALFGLKDIERVPIEEITFKKLPKGIIEQPISALLGKELRKVIGSQTEKVRVETAIKVGRKLGKEKGARVEDVIFNLKDLKNVKKTSRIIEEFGAEADGIFFGSSTTLQLPKEFRVKQPGDVDVYFPDKPVSELKPALRKLVKELRKSGEDVRISPRNPGIIEFTKTGDKLLEAKSGIDEFVHGEEAAPAGFLGFTFADIKGAQMPAVVQFGKGFAITAGEQLLRKASASLIIRGKSIVTETLPKEFAGAGILGKAQRTVKDIAGFVLQSRGLIALIEKEAISPLRRLRAATAKKELQKFLETFTPKQRKIIEQKIKSLTAEDVKVQLVTTRDLLKAQERDVGSLNIASKVSLSGIAISPKGFVISELRTERERKLASPNLSKFSRQVSPSPKVVSPSVRISPSPSPRLSPSVRSVLSQLSKSPSPRQVSPSPSPGLLRSPSLPPSPSPSPKPLPSPKPVPSPSLFPPPGIKVRPPLKPPIRLDQELSRAAKVTGFKTFVIRKRRRVFLPGVAGRAEALRKGAKVTRETLAATFGVIPTSLKVPVLKGVAFEPSERIFRRFRIKKGKRIPIEDVFIQKAGTRVEGPTVRGARFGTPMEIRELAQARKFAELARAR